jgi:hypothetical protein
MRWPRRRVQTVTTWVMVVAWVVFYAVALTNADPLPPLETAVRQLVFPPLLWVVAARLVLRHWWSGPGSRTSGMDLPGRLVAVAVAALPERRREWGRAMLAELAEVEGGRPGGGSRSAVSGPCCGCHRRAVGRCWPVVPLGPAGRRLDRDRHDPAHLRHLAARGAASSRDRRQAARRRRGGGPRRREPGRCPGLLPRHRSRARPHARGDRRRSRLEDHPSRRPRRSVPGVFLGSPRDWRVWAVA